MNVQQPWKEYFPGRSEYYKEMFLVQKFMVPIAFSI